MARQKVLGIKEYRTAAGIRFAAQVRVKGKPEMSKTFDTREAAAKWKAEMTADAGRGKFDGIGKVPADMTVPQLLALYVEQYPTRNKGQTLGYHRERHYARLAAHSTLANVLVINLNNDTMIDFATARVNGDGVKPSTVASEFKFFQVAVKRVARWNKWRGFNPLNDCGAELREEKLVADSFERTRRPSGDEMDALVGYFTEQADAQHPAGWINIPMADIISFLSMNAFRRGELTDLRWSLLHVEQSLIECRRKDSSSEGGKRSCLVPIIPAAMDIIKRQPRIEGEDRIFPYNPDTISGRFTEACLALGINAEDTPEADALCLHDLRHEAISEMSKHLSMSQGMAVSGHKSPKHYMRYVNLKKEDLTDVAAKLAAVKVKTSNVTPIRKAA